jgi:hypothetical protein
MVLGLLFLFFICLLVGLFVGHLLVKYVLCLNCFCRKRQTKGMGGNFNLCSRCWAKEVNKEID